MGSDEDDAPCGAKSVKNFAAVTHEVLRTTYAQHPADRLSVGALLHAFGSDRFHPHGAVSE